MSGGVVPKLAPAALLTHVYRCCCHYLARAEADEALFTIPRLSTLSSKAFTLDCTTQMTYMHRLLLIYFTPVIIAVVLFAVYVGRYFYFLYVIRISLAFRKDIIPRFQVALIVSLFLIWPSITMGLMEIFICTTVSGQRVLVADTRVVCGGSMYNAYYITSIIYFVVFCIGAPLALLVFMQRNAAVRTGKFRIITLGYKRKYWYNDFLIMLRKLALIFIVAAPASLQALIASIVLLLAMHVHLSLRPFADQSQKKLYLGGLETLSLVATLVTSQFGLYFFNSAQSSAAYAAASWIVFSLNTLLIVYFVYYIITYIRKTEDVVGNWKNWVAKLVKSKFSIRDQFWLEGEVAAGNNMMRMDDDKL